MGTGSLAQGYSGRVRGLNLSHPSSAEVKERVKLYLYSPSGPLWPILGRALPFMLPNTATYVSYHAA